MPTPPLVPRQMTSSGTTRTTSPRVFRAATLAVFSVLAPLVTAASAQNRPSPALDVSAGWVGFADDGIVSEAMVGGAGRLYVTPRLALGPELVHIVGDDHSHTVLTGNLTFDLVGPTAGRPARVTPFLVVGGGLYQTRESFGGDDYTHNEGAFTAGGGVRATVSDRVSVGVDARIGWETHVRVNALVGIRLGG